jgi:hypothetical protein
VRPNNPQNDLLVGQRIMQPPEHPRSGDIH